MKTELIKLVSEALPALSGSGVTYNAERNMLLTPGYTSQMGHTYFQGVQLSNCLAVVYDIGRGGWGSNPLFLNGVKLYRYSGREKQLIGNWSPCGWSFYSDSLAHHVAVNLLFSFLKSQMKMIGVSVSDDELLGLSNAQIEAVGKTQNLLY